MIKIKIILITCTSLIFNILFGQPSPQIHSGEIYQGIRKLNELGSVLYIAAHPDDENTRLITCLSKEYNIRTAYLSLTRGDGGQNLIGPELDEFLGVIRTNELVEARKIDGGSQYFTSAVDFGYSKNAEETFKKWDREKIID
ncbi:MAG: PIG-L family deacetylase [Saprospiraceae bacterium]|nr:PIG-L family deacetylase [Saprospiraceae bacterium]